MTGLYSLKPERVIKAFEKAGLTEKEFLELL
jgi:hypothetical protein